MQVRNIKVEPTGGLRTDEWTMVMRGVAHAWVVECGALGAALKVAALVVHVNHALLAVVAAVACGVLPRDVERRVLIATLGRAPP